MNGIDMIPSFRDGGLLLAVQAGVSKKDLILGEVTDVLSCWREIKPSQNRQSLFITDDIGVTGNVLSCSPTNPDSDAMVASYQWRLVLETI